MVKKSKRWPPLMSYVAIVFTIVFMTPQVSFAGPRKYWWQDGMLGYRFGQKVEVAGRKVAYPKEHDVESLGFFNELTTYGTEEGLLWGLIAERKIKIDEAFSPTEFHDFVSNVIVNIESDFEIRFELRSDDPFYITTEPFYFEGVAVSIYADRVMAKNNLSMRVLLKVDNELIACGKPVKFDGSKNYGSCRGFKFGTKCDNDIVDIALSSSWHGFTCMRVYCTTISKRAYCAVFMPSESMSLSMAERRAEGLVAEIERRGAEFKINENTYLENRKIPVECKHIKSWSSMSKTLSVQIQVNETTNNLYDVSCDVSSREMCRLASFESAYHRYQLHHLKTKDQERKLFERTKSDDN